ncbi:MAG: NUDIX hydrolase N-terminal domain-containing protein [Cyanobacteriota bacterium]
MQKLEAIAQNSLKCSENPFALQRYKSLRAIAA